MPSIWKAKLCFWSELLFNKCDQCDYMHSQTKTRIRRAHDLKARHMIFCQWRSLPGSVCLNSVIRFDCLMCLMKSFLRIWSKSFLHKSLPNLIHPTSPSWSAIALTSTMSSSFSSIPYLSQIVRSFEDADEDEVSSTWLIRYEQNHDICIS